MIFHIHISLNHPILPRISAAKAHMLDLTTIRTILVTRPSCWFQLKSKRRTCIGTDSWINYCFTFDLALYLSLCSLEYSSLNKISSTWFKFQLSSMLSTLFTQTAVCQSNLSNLQNSTISKFVMQWLKNWAAMHKQ